MAITTSPPPSGRIDHAELRRFLYALRLQLWWRDALAVAAASAAVGALIGVVALVWPTRQQYLGDGTLAAAWLMLVALAVGLLVAAIRRPSVLRAARVADRQLSTASRLATAAEVLQGNLGGALAPAQLDDAWRTASAITPWHAFPQGWRGVQVALAAVAISLVVLALSLGGVLSPLDVSGLSPSAAPGATAGTDQSQLADAAAATDAQALPLDPSSNPAAAAQTLEELQAAAAQSQAAEAALQKLGDALRGTAAARDVGEAIRRGDYDEASTKLNNLGRDADQLSRISKRELANTMTKVAYDSAKLDPPLAVAEDSVAKALNRQVYSETRAALERLARTVTDVKKGVVSQEDLAKSLDQLQQQPTTPTGGGGGGDSPDNEYYPDIPGEEPKQAGLVRGATSSIQVPGPEGDPRTANRADAGLNPGGDPLGDLASRLNVPPIDISVEAQLANDKGRDKANPAAPTVKISDTNQNGVRTSNVAQPGDPVQDVAEQTIEPTANRDAVRAFFKSAGDTAQPQTP
jgi:hypothetical protein